MKVEEARPLAEPTGASALLPLARQAANAGAYGRVSELYAAAERHGIAASELPAWRRLLIEAGDFQAAGRAGWTKETGPTAGPASGDTGDDSEFLDFEPGSPQATAPGVPGAHTDAFARWFAGRGDVYSRQWYDARRDRTGYWPVREALSGPTIEAHLLGRLTVGQYVLHPDNTVSFAAIDFDPTPEALDQLRLDGGAQGGLGLPAMVDYAGRVRRTADTLGLAPALEDTGGVGLHLWFFFAPRIPAERARGLMREVLWRAGAQPPAVAVEIFPKQDRLGGKGLGNLIKLPFGVHQVTLRRSCFLDEQMNPLADGDAMASLRASDPAAIDRIIARRVVPLAAKHQEDSPPGHPQPLQPPPPLPSGPSPKEMAEALAAIAPEEESIRAADRILAGCSVVRELARKAEEERTLSAGEARALLYTVGLVGRKNSRIEDLFAQAGISRKELDRARNGLQSPMGCRRLREMFADRCRGCARPAPEEGGYETPALFALRRPPGSRRRAVDMPIPEEIARDPSDFSLPELRRWLSRIEAMLRSMQTRDNEE